MGQMSSVEFVTAHETWLTAATLVFAAWLSVRFLEASVLPGVGTDAVAVGLPASVVLFGVGFGLFVRAQNRS
jgi:hypothetical protein